MAIDYRPRFTPVVRALVESEPRSIRGIADHSGLTHSAVSQTVAEMKRRRLVSLVQDKADARARLVRPTPRCRAMLPRLQRQWTATNSAADGLDAELSSSLRARSSRPSRRSRRIRSASGSRECRNGVAHENRELAGAALAVSLCLAEVLAAAESVSERRAAITRAADLLESNYVYPTRPRAGRGLAARGPGVLGDRRRSGRLRAGVHRQAARLSTDGHFHIDFREGGGAAAEETTFGAAEFEKYYGKAVNHGFEQVRGSTATSAISTCACSRRRPWVPTWRSPP